MTAPTLDTYSTPGIEIPRDRWGRPLIIPPGGGQPVGYTRASTLGKALEDQTALTKWKQRMTLIGAHAKPSLLLDVAAAVGDPDERRLINDLVEQAMVAAQSEVKAQVGTALHKVTQRLDEGQPVGTIPAQYARDVEAYLKLTTGAVRWHGIEQFVVCDELEVAGTFDGLAELLCAILGLPAGSIVIVDKKTSQDVDLAAISIAVQLAVYAHGERYDPATGQRTPLPPVDQNRALVIAMPSGSGTAEWVEVDIADGWRRAVHATKVRRDQRTAKTLLKRGGLKVEIGHAPAAPAPAPAPVTVFPIGETGQLVQTAAGPQIVARPHSQAPASPPGPGPVVTVPDGVVNPATGEVHAQADDGHPAGAAVLALLRQVFATIGAPWPAEAGRLTNLDVRRVLTHWDAVQLDAAEGKLEVGQTPAAAMVEFLIGGGLVPDGTLAQPRVPAPGGPTMPTLAVPAAPAGPSAADVLAWIPQAPTEADLTALWQQYGGTPLWDARHDGFAGARFQQLQAQAMQQAADLTGQHLGATSAA